MTGSLSLTAFGVGLILGALSVPVGQRIGAWLAHRHYLDIDLDRLA